MVSVELYCVLFFHASFASDQELVCAPFFLALHHHTLQLEPSMQLTHHVETGTLTFLIELTMIARAKDTVSPLLVF